MKIILNNSLNQHNVCIFTPSNVPFPMKQLLLPALALALLTQCQKSAPAPDPTKPEDQLPPATQTGANTFGCLVNGQPWTPQGYNGSSNYSVVYDAKLNGGNFDLKTYRYPDKSNDFQGISLNILTNARVGTFSIQGPDTRAVFNDNTNGCYWSSRDNTTTYRRGSLTITRLDLAAGVIAGTFEFTLYQPGCDSVRVTQGRFDKKL